MNIFILLAVLFFSAFSLDAFSLDNLWAKPTPPKKNEHSLDVQQFFRPCASINFSHTIISTDPIALLHVAKDTLAYINSNAQSRKHFLEPAGFSSLIPLKTVKETLKFIVQTIQEDLSTKKFRIKDHDFLANHFNFLAWRPDQQAALQHNVKWNLDTQIWLTHYAAFVVNASKTKTKNTPYALYQLNDHSKHITLSKHQILSGVLEKPAYKKILTPLAWVSRHGLEEALMQGTVVTEFNDGTFKILNVDKHNGIAYKKGLSNPHDQQRYWFFREKQSKAHPCSKKWYERIKQRGKVIFAGDITHIGFGKIVALMHQNRITKKNEIHLGVLADTGNNFVNNLYQLDLFAGVFPDKISLKSHLEHYPDTTHAFIMYKKPDPPLHKLVTQQVKQAIKNQMARL